MGYAEKLATPIDMNCSRMETSFRNKTQQKNITSNVVKQLDKTEQRPEE